MIWDNGDVVFVNNCLTLTWSLDRQASAIKAAVCSNRRQSEVDNVRFIDVTITKILLTSAAALQ